MVIAGSKFMSWTVHVVSVIKYSEPGGPELFDFPLSFVLHSEPTGPELFD